MTTKGVRLRIQGPVIGLHHELRVGNLDLRRGCGARTRNLRKRILRFGEIGLCLNHFAKICQGERVVRDFRFYDTANEQAAPPVSLLRHERLADQRERVARAAFADIGKREIVLHVRSVGDPLQLTRLVEREVHAIDPNLPVFDVKTQEMQVDEMLDRERLIAVLSGLFGVLATLLAATGLYGVMAYSVARRTKEIGIRMAVGASAGDVITLVLRETAGLTASGIFIGLPIAFGLARFAQSLLYEMQADDIRVFVGVSVVLLAVGLTAGVWPARRAARTEPVAALRTE